MFYNSHSHFSTLNSFHALYVSSLLARDDIIHNLLVSDFWSIHWVDYLIMKKMLQRYNYLHERLQRYMYLHQVETFQILRYHQPLIIVKITPTPSRNLEKLKKIYVSNLFLAKLIAFILNFLIFIFDSIQIIMSVVLYNYASQN